jgi:RimJ/RimL family protein N-acetyltransferase
MSRSKSGGSAAQGLTWPSDPLVSGPIALRPFRPLDLGLVAELAEDPYVPLIGTVPDTFTEAAGLAYIERQHQRLADGTGYSFCVADAATDHGLGTAGLWLRNRDEGRCSVGYSVSPRARGRGVATAALTALTAFAWTHPDLHRIELYVEPANRPSVAVAERCGYQREALLRSHMVIGEQRRDMLLYAALRP